MSIFKRYLQIRYHLIGIFLVLFIMLIPSEKAHAAGFRHVHTPACYSQQSVVCNKHHIRRDEHQANYHCFTCQYQLMFTEVTYWSVCENSGQNGYPVWPDRDVAYVQTCPNCGSTRRNEAPPSYYEHTVTISVLSCGFDESSTAATVSLTPSLTDWTNGPVTLTAGVNISDPSFSLAGSPYDFGAGASGSNSVEVFSNGTYSVTVRSADGQSATETVTVSNIDTTAPSLNLSLNTDGWCESGIKVLASASDGESGLADEAYSYNGGAFTSSGEFTATANGDVRVAVRDKAGNVTEQTITVSKVGRDPAVIAAEREAAERAAAEQARIERERAEKEAAERAAAEKAAAEKKAAKKAAAEKEAAKKAAAEQEAAKKAAAEKEAAEKAAAEQEAAEKAAAEQEAAEKAAAEQEAAEKAAAEQEAVKEAAAEEEAAEKAAEQKESEADLSFFFLDDSLPPEGTSGLKTMLMSVGNAPLYTGILMLVLSVLFFSFFNYVYVSTDGKKRPVAIAKIKYDQSKVLVVFKKSSLASHGRYLVYLSPWVKLLAGKRPIYGHFSDGKTLPFPLEGGRAFTY